MGDIRLNAIAESLASTTKYTLIPDALRRPAPPVADAVLNSTGDNLPAVLDSIASGPDRSAIVALEKSLGEAIPTVRGIALHAAQNFQKSLEFTLSGNGRPLVTIPAMMASEGALLITAFLALAYGNTPQILLIEEPENGLHPSRLKLVIDTLRKISTGEVGNRPRQVLVTSHSPLLLNYAKPEEIRIFRRDPEKGTQVTPMTKVKDLDKLLQEFAVGELWYLLGEEELLKEQPA
jgi:predicted ATPase